SKPFEFKKVVLPDLATIRIVVCEESGKMLAHRILPVVSIRPGYRHLTLRNPANQPLGLATLFVKIGVKDFVPDVHLELVKALLDPIAAVKSMDDFANALVNPIAAVNLLQKHEEMLKSLTDQDNAADDGVPDDGTGRPPSSDRGSIKNRNDPV
uniref:Uncharacterized protein n=1 Tax=Plectus sambesii TaxID=2011161 RepID=A0A914XIF1_9BILA